VLEGVKTIDQCRRSGIALDALVGTSADASFVPDVELADADLTQLIGFRPHSPLIGLVRIPEPVDVDRMAFPAIALEGVSDAANVGAIVRTAAGLGVRTLVTDAATSWARASTWTMCALIRYRASCATSRPKAGTPSRWSKAPDPFPPKLW
jgi:hypothetical protein